MGKEMAEISMYKDPLPPHCLTPTPQTKKKNRDAIITVVIVFHVIDLEKKKKKA